MKCPNCGLEIPEGHMYCDSCGTEINFVPDFEPEVENEINATLSGMADELNKDERVKQQKKEKRKKVVRSVLRSWKIIFVVIFVIALCVAGSFAMVAYKDKTALYYLSLAENTRSSGDVDGAIECLVEGHTEHPDNTDIIFRLSDYYLEKGDIDGAVNTLMIIADSSVFPQDKVLNAYESIISIYDQNGKYEEIAQFLGDKDNDLEIELYEGYIPSMPSISPASGTFTEVSVSIFNYEEADNNIYYTVNDGEPDSGSILYENEIVLVEEGSYDIKAVSINKYGIKSVVAQEQYVIEKGVPDPPEIMEPSGEYNQNTMIVAVAQAGCTIFYTTDGSDPTMDSKQYISPITMPVGSSHFRFIAYDSEGECSEIVDRDYHLVYTRLVSTEQAVNMLVNTLVRLDFLLDTDGKVRGLDGHNEYIYNSVIEIPGAGEYYMIVENHVSYDGITTPTGLMYAVNTHDGTVNRLGYDSSGNYTLITISNR